MSTICLSSPIANVTDNSTVALEPLQKQKDIDQLVKSGPTIGLIEVSECKKANGIYEPHSEAYNGKPVWKRSDNQETRYIFYVAQKKAWFLNSKLSKDGGFASVCSTADLPPLGCWSRSGQAVLVALEPHQDMMCATIGGAIEGETEFDTMEVRECKKANGMYKLQPELHNSRELWRRTGDGACCYIFFNAERQAWCIHSKLGNQAYASASSTPGTPPLGRWDSSGLAVLVSHAAHNTLKNLEHNIALVTSEGASRQLEQQWEAALQQFASLLQVKKRDLQEFADRVECVVTDAEGARFTRYGKPDLSDDMAELEFPLKIHLRFFEPNAKLDKPPDDIAFATVGAGRLAARGAPGGGVMAEWVHRAGATWVVTLVRFDEPAFPNVHKQATALMEEGSLKGWLHLPLSGGASCMSNSDKRRSKALKADDQQSLSRVKEVAKLLKQGESVIVHCAAGMHRTGIVCYMTLRLLGQSSDEALKSIGQSRPVTHVEVTKTTKRHPPLYELAEQQLSSEK